MSDPTPTFRNNEPTIATVPADTVTQPRRIVTGGISWRKTFAAFRHRNYRLFFSGQLVSVIGTWMQQVAIGWLVYQLSNSAFTLGAVRFLSAIPITLLTLVGGAMADRVEKRRIVIITESTAMVLAFVLATLVHLGIIRIWQIALIGLLEGITDAFDIPARQAFVIDMVGKDDLMNAIALNSSLLQWRPRVRPRVGRSIDWRDWYDRLFLPEWCVLLRCRRRVLRDAPARGGASSGTKTDVARDGGGVAVRV